MGDRVILHMWTKEAQHSVRKAHRVCVCVHVRVCMFERGTLWRAQCVCVYVHARTQVYDGKGQTLTCVCVCTRMCVMGKARPSHVCMCARMCVCDGKGDGKGQTLTCW